jgi:hypothetical protein
MSYYFVLELQKVISIYFPNIDSVKLMHHPLSHYSIRLDIQKIIFVTLIMTTILIITTSPLKNLYASPAGIDFYSPNSPPAGVKSLEPLIAKWWNWRIAYSSTTNINWPECLKGDGGIIGNNQSVVFLGDPVGAIQPNVGARNQKCEISSNQLLYLTVYAAECSTRPTFNGGECPNAKSPAELLNLAQDANKGIKVMQVKVDGQDVSSNIVKQTTSQPFNLNIPPNNTFDYRVPIVSENNTSMAEDYYLFFKPLPVGDHTIELHVIRHSPPAEPENLRAKWNIKVVP